MWAILNLYDSILLHWLTTLSCVQLQFCLHSTGRHRTELLCTFCQVYAWAFKNVPPSPTPTTENDWGLHGFPTSEPNRASSTMADPQNGMILAVRVRRYKCLINHSVPCPKKWVWSSRLQLQSLQAETLSAWVQAEGGKQLLSVGCSNGKGLVICDMKIWYSDCTSSISGRPLCTSQKGRLAWRLGDTNAAERLAQWAKDSFNANRIEADIARKF